MATVTITPGADTVLAADSLLLTVTARDAEGMVLTGRSVTWSSSAPAIAAVTTGGWVRGVGLGAATITATVEGKDGSAAVAVEALVSVSPELPSLFTGDTILLRTVLTNALGDTLASPSGITWSSGTAGVATVSNSGVVSGVTPGMARITAAAGSRSGAVDVVVLAIPSRANREIGYARSNCQSVPCTDELRVIRPDNLQDASLGPPLCFLSQTAWSPDGSRLAVALLTCTQIGQLRSGIWVRDSAGTLDTLLHGGGLVPTWAPDGSRVAFMVRVGNDHELYSNDVMGTDLRRLTSDAAAVDEQPDWSPDGRQIVWMRRTSTANEIWLMRADGSNQRRLRPGAAGTVADPRWSPDGKWIAYVENSGLWVVSSGGGAPSLVEQFAGFHRWTPDARSLVFVRGTAAASQYDLVVRGRDGSNRRVITALGTCYSEISVSPDGQQLAYVCPDLAQAQAWPTLFVVPITGGTPVPLTTGVNVGHVHWRP